MTSPISSLIESQHAAIYAYGIIAAYAPTSSALDDMAIHRRMRDELIQFADLNSLDIPVAQPAYQIPLPVRDEATAKSAATVIENLLCAHWSQSMHELDPGFASMHVQFPIDCAVRAYAYSGQFFAFPGSN